MKTLTAIIIFLTLALFGMFLTLQATHSTIETMKKTQGLTQQRQEIVIERVIELNLDIKRIQKRLGM